MDNQEKNNNNHYLTLWICVFIAGLIIFGGWAFSVRYNFNKINREAGSNEKKDIIEEMQNVFGSFKDSMSKTVEEVNDNLVKGKQDITVEAIEESEVEVFLDKNEKPKELSEVLSTNN